MAAYAVQNTMEPLGFEVATIDVAFVPRWMVDARIRKAYEWLSLAENVSKPHTCVSVYAGFDIRELVSARRHTNLVKVERLVSTNGAWTMSW